MDDDDMETLSFKKLHKMITENHPVDPNTQEKFAFGERLTVKNYNKKLFDVCCIMKCIRV